jgi:7,8-dihydropterin-6-yl-methyl-4-(beta-D-ribofuranosyl)aminobenzene 5'-phosphate synthase
MADSKCNSEVTVLVDDCAGPRKVVAEHGLAIWIQTRDARILFDTGQGLALTRNAEELGVDLRTADAVVLSHGHYDHTDGLAASGDRLTRASLFVHPAAFQRKFAGSDRHTLRPVGSAVTGLVRARTLVAGVTLTEGWTEVAPGAWVTGEIPRRTDFEDTGGQFFLDEELEQPDPIVDDQALVLETDHGLAVLLGCGHAGLVNTLDHVAEQTGERRLYLVLGGLHLLSASRQRIDRSVDGLRRYGVSRVGPAHCTGLAASARLLQDWGSGFVPIRAGTRLRI